MPVANQGEDQQQKGDEEQAGGFRGINRVPAVRVAGTVLTPRGKHTGIVRPAMNSQPDLHLPATPRALSRV